MHIMHVTDSLSVGGKERVLVDIANNSPALGMEVSVCVTRSGMELASQLNPRIPVIALNRRQVFDIQGFRKFLNAARVHHVDIFQAHGRSSFSFLAFLKQLGFISAPIILHDHFGIDLSSRVPAWFRLWGKYHLSHYVGVNEGLGEWAGKIGIVPDKVSVIENGLDLERFSCNRCTHIRKSLDLPDEAIIGASITRISREKGVDFLIRALAQSEKARGVVVLIIGRIDDPEFYEECKELVRAHLLEKNIVFLGQRLDIAQILSEVDFALHPSRSEGDPITLMEYMACGVPFVATQVGSYQKITRFNTSGFVPRDDVSAFALAVSELLELSPEQRRARGQLGQKIVREQWDISHAMTLWHRLYDQVLEKER